MAVAASRMLALAHRLKNRDHGRV